MNYSEEDKLYESNSLSTGATPYKIFYGKNYKCPYQQCSGIRVTAPAESDIVVIIKNNNQNGKVIAHGYIRAGASYQFPIPDGTYQTFFYYGTGWNPNKDMGNGIKGGFVKKKYSRKIIHKIFITLYLPMSFNCKEMVISKPGAVVVVSYFNKRKSDKILC